MLPISGLKRGPGRDHNRSKPQTGLKTNPFFHLANFGVNNNNLKVFLNAVIWKENINFF